MTNPPTVNKKIPWLLIVAVALVMIIIGVIYVVKNPLTTDKVIEFRQENITAQASDNSDQTNIERSSDSANSTEQASTTENSQQASAAKTLPKLVDLGSTTCIPCQEMAPILEELKNEYNGKVDVEVVDVYENSEKAMEYNAKHPLSVIPTQILYDANGKEVWSHEGSMPKEEIIKVFNEKLGVE